MNAKKPQPVPTVNRPTELPTSPSPPRADERSRIDRLLNYKRYIDWVIERELKRYDDR